MLVRMDRRRAVGWVVGLLVVDVLLAVGVFARAWAHPSSVTAGARQDAPYTIWAMAWVARAVVHGRSPWLTTALSWPSGVNLLTNATATGLGLALLPVTLVAGPLVAYNVAATAALALTAWSTQVVIRRSGLASWPAAAAAGLVGGFGASSLVQTVGDHLHISAAFLLPPMALGVGRVMSGTARKPVRWGAALGILAAAQLLIGEEVLAIAVVALAVGAAAAVAALGVRWVPWKDAGVAAVAAWIAFSLLAVGPLVIQFTGRGHINGPIQVGDHYANDLTGFVVPVKQLWLRTAAADRITGHYSSEGGTYLGIPLLIVAAIAVVRRWSVAAVRVLGLSLATIAVLSLGARLTIDGHRTSIPMPWAALGHVPLLSSLLPVRFGIVLDLLAAALLAVALDAAAAWGRGRAPAAWWRAPVAGALAGLVALACLLPLVPRLPGRTTVWAVPAAFRHPGATGIADGALVVVSPYPSERDPQIEVWLAAAGARWSSAGGTYFVPDEAGKVTIGGPARPADVIDAAIEAGRPAASFPGVGPAILASLRQEGVSAVLVGPGPGEGQVLAWWRSVLGSGRAVGGIEVWQV